MYNIKAIGELAERLKAPSWKGGEVLSFRGFKSLILRQIKYQAHYGEFFYVPIVIRQP